METEFVNGHERHRENPVTFLLPPISKMEKLKRGDFVKLACGGERFWVMITKINGCTYGGVIDNELVLTSQHGLRYGDSIQFEKHHILSIYE